MMTYLIAKEMLKHCIFLKAFGYVGCSAIALFVALLLLELIITIAANIQTRIRKMRGDAKDDQDRIN